MAYVAITSGVVPVSAPEYVGTVVDSNDWASVPTETAFLDFSTNTVLYKDANGFIYPAKTSREDTETNVYLTSSTQWSVALASSVPLPNGDIANGFTFFSDATDKVASGVTSYDEYDIAFGIDLTLTGTSGTANIGIDTGSGIVNYLATFNTDLATTVQDWIALHGATLGALGVNVLYNGGSPLNANGNETIRFCASESACNSVVITTLTGDLSGTRINPFTGVNAAAGDHCLIPYSGKAYNGQRLLHTMRVNFDISTGNQVQSAALTLRRFADDSIIGSSIKVDRDVDVPGNQFVFETYTNGANDPFVLGGFYFALENNSGNSLTFETKAGILIQTIFQRPTSFSS